MLRTMPTSQNRDMGHPAPGAFTRMPTEAHPTSKAGGTPISDDETVEKMGHTSFCYGQTWATRPHSGPTPAVAFSLRQVLLKSCEMVFRNGYSVAVWGAS